MDLQSDSNTWKAGKVRECFEWESAKAILAMELPPTRKDDFLYWKYHPSGRYTVKTGYYLLSKELGVDGSTLSARDQGYVKLIWKMDIQPKWKIFLWKLFYDGIANKSNLARRGIQVETICDHCGEGLEDSKHLFRSCRLAKEVWEDSSLLICPDLPEFISLKKWIQHYILLFCSEDGKNSTRCTQFIATLWGIWKTRNASCFREATGTKRLVLEFKEQALKDHETFVQQSATNSEVELTSRDNPIIPPGFNHVHLGRENIGYATYTMVVDGSWDKKSTRAGIGWAVSNPHQDSSIDEGGKYGAASSAVQCEAWACLEAMKWARAKGRQELFILTDSLTLLSNLKDKLGKDISIRWLLQELWDVGNVFKKCTVLKVPREQVQKAHDIARRCRLTLTNVE